MPMSLSKELTYLRKLKREVDETKERVKRLDKHFREVQTRVFDRMAAEEVGQMRVRGTLFVPTSTAFASMQDRDEFVAWAKANDDELIEVKERAALLNSLIRERLDNGQELPPGVGFHVKEVIAQRAA